MFAHIDTDVILDLLLDRMPFAEDAMTVFALAEEKKANLFFSSISFVNVYYMKRKTSTHKEVIRMLQDLLHYGSLLPVSEQVIEAAMGSEFSDFEDAVQYFSAKQNPKITHFITRNIKHYKNPDLIVMTPEMFVKVTR